MESLRNTWTLAILCTQWGDTGKGKHVDYFGQWAEVIARVLLTRIDHEDPWKRLRT